jgi:hypothetical protein
MLFLGQMFWCADRFRSGSNMALMYKSLFAFGRIAIRRGKYSRDTFTRRRRAWAGTIISGVYRNGAGPSGKSDQRLTEKVQQFV